MFGRSRRGAYFELDEDEIFEVFSVNLEDVQVPFFAAFVKDENANSFCGWLTANDVEWRTQFETDKSGVVVQQATIYGLLQKVLPARLCWTVLF